MAKHNNAVVIEISEEAYKQNTVYRPWIEIKGVSSTTKQNVPAGQLQNFSDLLRLRKR